MHQYDSTMPFKYYPVGVKELWIAFSSTQEDIASIPLTITQENDGVTVSYEGERELRFCRTLQDYEKLRPYLPGSEMSFLLKRVTYEACREIFGRSLPWGMLTGVRPGKILAGWERRGVLSQRYVELLTDVYLIEPDKAKLLVDIFQQQEQVRRSSSMEDLHVYIHIPFCPTKCYYCSFATYENTKWSTWHESYVGALREELKYFSPLFREKQVKSVYVGGGTPTALDDHSFRELMDDLKDYFGTVPEITVEAGRPDSLNDVKWEAMASFVSRVSLNAQTSSDKSLALVGRSHGFQDVAEAFTKARQWEIPTINTDLILGLPQETAATMRKSIRDVVSLHPENITVHTLAIKGGSRFKEEALEHLVPLRDTVDWSIRYLTDSGYHPYYLYRQKRMAENLENIGYAKPGQCNVYNVNMMEELSSTIGFGLGAATKWFTSTIDFETVHNVGDLHQYTKGIHQVIDKKHTLMQHVLRRS